MTRAIFTFFTCFTYAELTKLLPSTEFVQGPHSAFADMEISARPVRECTRHKQILMRLYVFVVAEVFGVYQLVSRVHFRPLLRI